MNASNDFIYQKEKNKILEIGSPKVRISDGSAELYADISLPDGKKKEIYYRVGKKWAKYLVTENADAFVANCIYYALSNGIDIYSQAPVSKALLYQLNEYYIPLMASSKPFFKQMKIRAAATEERFETLGYAGTGVSCGVDSFYTMLKHLGNTKYSGYELKTVLFQDWFSIGKKENEKKYWIEEFQNRTQKVSESLGLNYIHISCNIDEQLPTPAFYDSYYGYVCDKGLYTYKYCSAALALGKMIGKYYFSSGYEIENFELNHKDDVFDEDHYALFNISALSTENVKFYLYGGDASRIDKIAFISQFEIARKNLIVCAQPENCGHCLKCIRTMGEMYAEGKLDLFKETFPIEEYRRRLSYNIAVLMVNKQNSFCGDVLKRCKQNHNPIPVRAYILFPFVKLFHLLRMKLREVKWVYGIYDKLKNTGGGY